MYAIQAADVDGDGAIEIAVLRQTISPTFVDILAPVDKSFAIVKSTQLAGSSLDMKLVDLDQDGVLELIHSGYDAGSVVAMRSDGKAGFMPWKEVAVGTLPRGLAVADLDGNGETEVAAALESCYGGFQDPDAYCDPSETAIVRGLAGDTTNVTVLPTGPIYNDSVFFADLDLDDELDLVAIAENCGFQGEERKCAEQSQFAVHRNGGKGEFGPAELIEVGRIPTAGVAADLNGDSFPELAIAHIGPDDMMPTGRISVFLNLGDGSFAEPTIYAAGAFLYSLVALEINGDGVPDLVAADLEGQSLVVLLSDP